METATGAGKMEADNADGKAANCQTDPGGPWNGLHMERGRDFEFSSRRLGNNIEDATKLKLNPTKTSQ